METGGERWQEWPAARGGGSMHRCFMGQGCPTRRWAQAPPWNKQLSNLNFRRTQLSICVPKVRLANSLQQNHPLGR